MLRVFQGIMQGPEVADLPQREDMTPLELVALAPLVVAMVLLGLAPGAVAASPAATLAVAASSSAAYVAAK